MGLISVTDLDARRVEYEDADQAQAIIDDASAVVRAWTEPIFDSVDAPATPALVVAVVAGMVARALTNPRGLAQEQLGAYMYQAASNNVATLLPTARERKLLRRAAVAYAKANDMDVPSFGSDGVYMQADLPVPQDSVLTTENSVTSADFSA